MSDKYVDSDKANKMSMSSKMSNTSSERDDKVRSLVGSTINYNKNKRPNQMPQTDIVKWSDPLLDSDEFRGNMDIKTVEYHPRKTNFTYIFSYEETRARNKLGLAAAIVFMIKSAFGLGVFASTPGFAKVGYLLGAMICLLMCYVTTYGMYLVGNLANKIEDENRETNLKMLTYHDVAMACVKERFKTFIKSFVIFSLVLVNVSIPVASTVQISVFFFDEFEINTYLSKGVIGLIY